MISRPGRILYMMGASIWALTATSAFAQSSSADDAAPESAAPAQTESAPAAASVESADGTEIIVTADRRATSIQRVPIAVTALTGQDLSNRGVLEISSLAPQVPSFNFGQTFGVLKLAIRGIGFSNQSTGAEGSVAFNLNDVYISRPAAQVGQFYDIERVEVLRGPQGTLYGRNATGGAVNVHTARPGSSWEGFAELTVGNYNQIVTEAAVGGPISDTLGVRLAFTSEDRDGYGKNVATGNDIDDVKSRAARLTLQFEPSSTFTVALIGDIQRDTNHSGGNHLIAQRGLSGEPGTSGLPVVGVQVGGQAVIGGYDIRSDIDPQYRRRGGGLTLDARLALGDLTLRSVSGWRRSVYGLISDVDGTDAEIASIVYRESSDTYSQEFNANYSSGRFSITAGVYGFIENLNGFFADPANSYFIDGVYDPGNTIAYYAAGGHLVTHAFGGYAQLSYQATDRLTLIVGARYSTEKKKDDDLYTDYFTSTAWMEPASITDPNPPLAGPNTQSKRWNSFTPKFGINFQANPSTLLYASVSKGFKAGLFNLGGTRVTPNETFTEVSLFNQPVNPETVWAYEAGLKTRLLDNRVRLNLAGFYYDYSNLQLSKVEGQNVTLTNAASARLYGLEGEAEYVSPDDGLRVNLSASWLHTRFTDFFNTDQGRPGLGELDLRGNRLPQSPEFTVSGGIEYRVPIGGGFVVPRAQANYATRTYFDEFNSNVVSQPAYAKVDLSLAYESDRGFRVTGFVNNLTNKRTIDTAFQSSGLLGHPVNGFLAPPRTYGVRVRAHF
ncbi:TonB-dependent receptor [Sphingomonas sp. IC081]|uniref:TonB-dependent receptor n=1 Tax=Sphingomonas sp. IC081 TaxID=304378 RepID=UPI001158795C|nr:TonB-dependent receptor [Sphingomonas sp. IC081]QDK35712.1 TonB-dependent receptor [Sphingomonas sp. IC081]